jgi:hypothetical protein
VGATIEMLIGQSMQRSRCKSCGHMQEVISGKGSRFLLCRLSQTDPRFPKYPPQPVARCDGYEQQRIIEKK